ncbi:MAG: PH domain-containing protein, partial [Micromonosporaceae bacterium]
DLIWYGVLAVMARLLYQVAEWSADRFVVTDRRMLLISGLITRKVAMMPLTKVTDMTYEKPVIGRLLGYGEFIMESAGQDQALRRIRYVPAPDRLYREVSELLFGGATASPKVVPSTAKARGAPVGQPTE